MSYLLSLQAPVNRIQAIKLIRQASGKLLVECKQAFEVMETGQLVKISYVMDEWIPEMNAAGIVVGCEWTPNEHLLQVHERLQVWKRMEDLMNQALTQRDGAVALEFTQHVKKMLDSGSLIPPLIAG